LLGGRTLLERAAGNLAPVCAELVVVAAPGADDARYAVGGARVTHDAVEGEGPLAGIVAGLRAARAPRALVVAVDMPCVDARVLALLARAAPDADVTAPVVGGRAEPLHACWAVRAADALAAALAGGVRKVTDAWAGLAVHAIDEVAIRAVDPELRTLWNVNVPEDLERIRAAIGG